MSQLRPLALGELMDRAVSAWRIHWRPLYGLFLAFQLAEYALFKLAQAGLARADPGMDLEELLKLMKSHPDQALTKGLVMLAVTGGVGVFTFYVSQVAGVAGTAYVFPRLTEQGAPSMRASLQRAMRRLGATTGVFTLSVGWTVLVFVLTQIPAAGLMGAAVALADTRAAAVSLGIVGGLASLAGLVVMGVWYLVRFILTSQVVALEDVGTWKAYRRADQLSSGRLGRGTLGIVKVRLTVLITIVGLVVLVVTGVANLPGLALGAYYASLSTGGVVMQPPQYLLVPAELVELTLSSLVAPLFLVFQVMFYLDMRMRREGLDLELGLTRLGA
jgi:hypothetical protein